MKKIKLFVALFLIFLIYSCGGSESYQGTWKALDSKGSKFEITFTENKLLIKNSLGRLLSYRYIQYSAGHQGSSNNFTDTFEIRLNDGKNYQIFFPKDDQSVGEIRYVNGENAYSISKKEYLTVDEIYKSE